MKQTNNNKIRTEYLDAFVNYFDNGKTKEQRLGLELEHILVHKNTMKNVSYYEEFGQEFLLNTIAPNFKNKKAENGRLIGLSNEDYSITLEPGAQIEISITPKSDIKEIEKIYKGFIDLIKPILDKHDISILTLGYAPVSNVADIPLIPVKRYEYMNRYFKTSGKYGMNMMRGTASTQISVDYKDEKDFIDKYKVAYILSPIIKLLSSNIPYFENKKVDSYIQRSNIWNDVDNDRCNMFDGINNISFKEYSKSLLNINPIYIPDSDGGFETNGNKFSDLFTGGINTNDIEHMLSMAFPDVRLKTYVEIRMADSMPLEYVKAYLALVKGIFYTDALSYILENYKVDIKDIKESEESINKYGYDGKIYNKDATIVIKEIIDIAKKNLNTDDQKYLNAFYDLLNTKSFICDYINKERNKYIKYLLNNNLDSIGRKKAKDILFKSDIRYGKEEVNFSYIPLFINKERMNIYTDITKTLYSILEKVTLEYIKNEKYRKIFHFSNDMKSLILSPCNYERIIPIGRFDLFINEKTNEYMFCEFNTDGSSCMGRDYEVSKAIIESSSNREFFDKYKITPSNTINTIVDELIKTYKSDKNAVDNPTFCITDFKEQGETSDFTRFIEKFKNKGYDCFFTDVKDLHFDGEKLIDKNTNKTIHAIYRRVVTSELLKRINECEDLIKAVENEKVVLLGHFRTSIAHSKEVAVALYDKTRENIFNEKEIDFINKHIPKTYYLNDNLDKSIINDIKENKDNWILKPEEGFSASGVFGGKDIDNDTWIQLVDKNLNNHYIVQEFCKMYKSPLLPIYDEEIKEYNLMTGVFHCGDKVVGFYSRAGNNAIIDLSYGGFCVSTVYVQ